MTYLKKSKEQSSINNPETLATFGTQDNDEDKNITHKTLDNPGDHEG
jgi:hypothetical protein